MYEPSFRILVPQEGFNHIMNNSLEAADNFGVTDGGVTAVRGTAGQDIGGGKIVQVFHGNSALYVSTAGNSSGVYFNLTPLAVSDYTASIYVKPVNPANALPRIVFSVGGGEKTAQLEETTGDGFSRYTAYFTPAEVEAATTLRFGTASNNAGALLEVWIDAVQFERGPLVTTFINGTMGDGYQFLGVANRSTSWRKPRTRRGKIVRGGLYVPLDNGTSVRCEAALGIGVMPVTPITQERGAGPGTMYQSSTVKERAISLRFTLVARTLPELHSIRSDLSKLFQIEDGEFTLQYMRQGVTQEIDVVYAGGMDFGEIIGAASQKIVVQLVAPDPYFREVGFVMQPLTLPSASLATNSLALRQNGAWRNLSSGPGPVNCVYVTPDQTLYTGGSNDGNGNAYLRHWNESQWLSLGRVSGNSVRINGIKLSPSGQRLYIWGSFSTVAFSDGSSPVTVNNIAYYNLSNGTWNALGGGVNGEVHDLDFDSTNTYIYIAGAHTATADATVTLNRAGRWSIAGSAWLAMTSGLSGTAYAVRVLPNGSVAYGGLFNAAGALSSPVTGLGVVNLGSGSFTNIGRSYVVTAFDKQGRETAASSTVAATSSWPGTRLTWNAVFGAHHYDVYWYPAGGFTQGLLATGITGTQFDHSTQNTINAGYVPPTQNTAIGTGPGWERTNALRTQWNAQLVTGTPNIVQYVPSMDDWYRLGLYGFDGAVRVLINSKDGINLHAFGDFLTGEGGRVFNHAAYLLGKSFRAMGRGLGTTGAALDAVLASDGSIWVAGSHPQSGGRSVGAYLSQWRGMGELGTWLPTDFPAGGTLNGVALLYDEPVVGWNAWNSTISPPSVTQFVYRGTAYEYPIIMVSGPCRLVSIENLTTDTHLWFDLVLADGEQLTIDLRTGQKKMWSSAFDNLLDRILPGSDTGTFRVAPGTNRVAVHMTGTGGNTSARLLMRATHLSADATV